MKLPLPFRWLASNTCAPTVRPAELVTIDANRALLRTSFTTPRDPRWARYQAVVSTALPSAVIFN